MSTQTQTPGWYVTRTGTHQGLIVSEETGENIAVAYDKANAPVIAAAPELLSTCKKLVEWLYAIRQEDENLVIEHGFNDGFNLTEAQAVIAKAEGL